MTRVRTTPGSTGSPALDRTLGRGVDAGIVTREQAARLAALAVEVEDRPVATPAPPAVPATARWAPAPLLSEILGYIGGALAIAAGMFVAQEFWTDLAAWARAGMFAVLALATFASGAVLRDAREAAGRLASFLWWLTVPAVGGATAVLVDDLTGAAGTTVALSSVAAGTVVAWGLWALRRSPAQHVAAFAGLAATGATALVQIDASLVDGIRYWIWALGLVWLVLAARRVVEPAGTAWIVGALALVLGPLIGGEVDGAAAALLGVVSAGALVAVAVRLRRTPVIILGVLGLFLQVPTLLVQLFEGQVAAPAVVLVIGVALVGVSVLLARRSMRAARSDEAPPGPAPVERGSSMGSGRLH